MESAQEGFAGGAKRVTSMGTLIYYSMLAAVMHCTALHCTADTPLRRQVQAQVRLLQYSNARRASQVTWGTQIVARGDHARGGGGRMQIRYLQNR